MDNAIDGKTPDPLELSQTIGMFRLIHNRQGADRVRILTPDEMPWCQAKPTPRAARVSRGLKETTLVAGMCKKQVFIICWTLRKFAKL